MKHTQFKLIRSISVPEVSGEALEYVHIKTGASVVIVKNDDKDQTFSIGFRTEVNDSTGVAHILEHCVLSGSRKYPLKEPFIYLSRTSMNTFLNAYTYPQFTIYPVASQNTQDFYNLMDVYLDAVFYPTLSEQIFKQEGWHFEKESIDSDIGIRGIVYNEMKGSTSNPEIVFWRHMVSALLPDTPNLYNSGGDPKNIPELTYQEFVQFHKDHYHPSNSYIFFYGDGDTQTNLDKVGEYLDNFEQKQIKLAGKQQKKFSSTKDYTCVYPSSSDSDDLAHAAVGWMVDCDSDVDTLKFRILEYILFNSDSSPFKNQLLESGLGSSLTVSGYDDEIADSVFMTGLQGVKIEHIGQVHELIISLLTDLSQNLRIELVEAAINQIEFDRREISGGPPNGLVVLDWIIPNWMFGKDAFSQLRFEDLISQIREEISLNNNLFGEFISNKLLQNQHRVYFQMLPDPDLNQKRADQELKIIQEFESQLSGEQVSRLVEDTKELIKWQLKPDSPEDIAKIPVLQLKDLSKQVRELPSEEVSDSRYKTLIHSLDTKEIGYFMIGFDVSHFNRSQLNKLSILNSILDRLGTHTKSFDQLALDIDIHTGGISTGVLGISDISNVRKQLFTISGKSLLGKTKELVSLVKEILLEIDLNDRSRIHTILKERVEDDKSEISDRADIYAVTRALSGLDQIGVADDITEGISGFKYLSKLLQNFDDNWEELHNDLMELRDLVLGSAVIVDFIGSESDWQKYYAGELNRLDLSDSPALQAARFELNPGNELFTIPSDVNFVSLGVNIDYFPSELRGAMIVANRLISADYLWQKIRVEGGAYGAYMNIENFNQSLLFASYRDPNTTKTLEIYRNTGRYLMDLNLDQSELDKTIIGAIGKIDRPKKVSQIGGAALQNYLHGITDEYREETRRQLFRLTPKMINSVGEIMNQNLESGGKVVVIGGKKSLKGMEWITQDVQKLI